MIVDGEEFDEQAIRRMRNLLKELAGYRVQDVRDFFKVFSKIETGLGELTAPIMFRLSRLAGTSLLESGYILRCLETVRDLPGDWCEYGVAHGRTSALLAQCMLHQQKRRTLWLYDSFEGLPPPHDKDVLLHDIFAMGSMAAYAGSISIPEQYAIAELDSVRQGRDFFRVVKGWITLDRLVAESPEQISFAYLDMDLYQSTYDVLKFLAGRMVPGGIMIVDDYGFFSKGVQTAVTEIVGEYEGVFCLEWPFEDKFVILTKQKAGERGDEAEATQCLAR